MPTREMYAEVCSGCPRRKEVTSPKLECDNEDCSEEHVNRIFVLKRALAAKEKELGEAREKLDNLEVQAVRDVVTGWVSIPSVEWDSIMPSRREAGEGERPCTE